MSLQQTTPRFSTGATGTPVVLVNVIAFTVINYGTTDVIITNIKSETLRVPSGGLYLPMSNSNPSTQLTFSGDDFSIIYFE